MKKHVVITTINSRTKAVEEISNTLSDFDVLLIGDKKSQPIKDDKNLRFLNIERQAQFNFSVEQHTPYNHYSRKNLGYLIAASEGVEILYDTDDDNIPNQDWSFPSFDGSIKVAQGTGFLNVYKEFSPNQIWPRGYPLNLAREASAADYEEEPGEIAVWQGLVDQDPDVDAIYRLLMAEADFKFQQRDPIALAEGLYCPFNSQNTLWKRDMLPYAYLPISVTFRFTDILRGYIAQRCFWEHKKRLGFCSPKVYQIRNDHNLLKDFESEIPCYLRIQELTSLLDSLSLSTDYATNLEKIYKALYKADFVHADEIAAIRAWIKDMDHALG